MASARFPASAAFMLKKTARRPSASMVCTIACALGSVERRSRWTPKMSKPLRARSSAVAPPKPLEAPRISAQPLPSPCDVIVFSPTPPRPLLPGGDPPLQPLAQPVVRLHADDARARLRLDEDPLAAEDEGRRLVAGGHPRENEEGQGGAHRP